MGGEDDGRLARLDGAEQSFWRGRRLGPAHYEAEAGRPHRLLALPRRERGQRICIEDDSRRRSEHGQDGRRGTGADAGARADQSGVAAHVAQKPAQRSVAADAFDHDGRQVRCIDRGRRHRPDDRNQAGTSTQRAPRAHACRTCAFRRAGHHDRVTARVLVPIDARPGIRLAPQGRPIDEGACTDLLQRLLGDADVGDEHLAAQSAPRQEQVSRLQPEERHRAGRLHHRPPAGPGRAVEAARHVNGDDRRARDIDGRYDVRRNPVQRPRQAGAEQGVDDQVGAGNRGRGERLDGLTPALRHCSSVTLQRFAAAKQSETHLISLLAQQPRRHETIAAIVAGPASDGDRGPCPRCDRDRGFGHGAARVLHQHEARHAVRRSKGVGTAHLGSCEQFVAGQDFSFFCSSPTQHIMRHCGARASVAEFINKSVRSGNP